MNQLWLELATPTPGGSTRHLHRMKEVSKTYRPLETLKLWENNPRTISEENFERLKRQIKKLGEYKPLVITPDGTVLGGNMRLRAYRELGFKKAWVSVVHPKSEEEKIEYALSDNDRVGEYQEDELANLIGNYPNLDLETFAVDLGKAVPLSDLQVQEIIEDEPPEVEEGETVSELGEVYQLGRHRLMCGDATKKEDVERLMNGEMADMVFTDPPYALFGNSTGVANVTDDKMIRPFFRDVFNRCKGFTKKYGHIYVCCDWHSAFTLQDVAQEVELAKKNMCIWYKGAGGVGAMYQMCYEIIWFFSNSPIQKTTMGDGKSGERTVNGVPNVWEVGRESERLHNAVKPVEMIKIPLTASSDDGESVLDLFGGSGSTLIACEQLNRICYMMEIDPKYCDVIRKRYAKFIGKEEQWQKITPTV